MVILLCKQCSEYREMTKHKKHRYCDDRACFGIVFRHSAITLFKSPHRELQSNVTLNRSHINLKLDAKSFGEVVIHSSIALGASQRPSSISSA